MRFNFVIMNPPYDRNLHLKFLEKVIKVAGKVVNISPVRWLQDPFAPYNKNSDYCKFEESLSKHIESLKVIDAKCATNAFEGAAFTMNLGIYVFSDKGGYNYKHNNILINKIVTKTRHSNWEPYAQKKFYMRNCEQEKQYVINIGGVMGGPICCTTYAGQLKTQLSKKSSIFNGGGGGAQSAHFEFDTEEERRNFYDCYASPFMKWTYTLWKTDNQNRLDKVPYFGDYTKPWTNERFCEYFGITGFVSDTEAEPGSEWETILHCINNLNKQDKR